MSAATTIKNILDKKTALSTDDIHERTGIKYRTIRYAVRKLKEEGVILEKVYFRDMRKVTYLLK